MELNIFRSPEQKQFFTTLARHIAAPDAPLLIEGDTGLGKTRAYLAAVMQSGKRVAVVLPTHALIDQLLSSTDLAATRGVVDVAAFRPARFFASRAEYETQREIARAASVMICTAASVIIDQRLSGEYTGVTTDRDYILFDEADQLPDMAALQSDFHITADNLSDLHIPLTTAADTVAAILNKPPRTVEPEVRAAAAVIAEALSERVWFQSAGIDDAGGVVLTHKLPLVVKFHLKLSHLLGWFPSKCEPVSAWEYRRLPQSGLEISQKPSSQFSGNPQLAYIIYAPR